MKRIKIVLFAMIICCSMVLGTACEKNRNSDIDESHEEDLVISDTATRYEFPSDNILQYKGVIIDKEFIIYVFGWGSSMARDLFNKRDDKMKVWLKKLDDSYRKVMGDWKVVQNPEGYYLVIYCDPQTIDLEVGLAVSNFLQEEGKWDFGVVDNIAYYVTTRAGILRLEIWKPGFNTDELWQSYIDGAWSEIYEHYSYSLD
ncbi:MAG: hypothetical protein IJL20_10670 [Lachnospiraceae bacterium]|nr:hypothetical protein [Lachnospiraceae bacterium]